MSDSEHKVSFDPAEKAQDVLEYVLDETSERTQKKHANEVAVEAELYGEQVIKEESARVKSRVLFITNDQSIYTEHSEARKHFVNLTEVFDEIHVVVLGMPKKKDPRLAKAGVSGFNKPKRTPNHPKKSHVVVAKEGDKIKTIRYGEQGAKTAGKPKKGESAATKAKRKSFKARHGKNIAKGKMSAAYWANKSKW